MDTVQVWTFLAVVEAGSFTAAASRLFTSQATVSCRIKALESELGQKLLERDSHSVQLTEAGARFLPFAQAMVSAEAGARAELDFASRSKVLRVGVSPSTSSYLAPFLAERIRAALPDHELSLLVDEVPSLMNRVADGEIDAAVVEPCFIRKGVALSWFMSDVVVVAAAADGNFSRIDSPIDARTLMGLPFVMRHQQCCTLEFVRKHLRNVTGDPSASLDVIAWINELEALKNMVRVGRVVTAMSEWALIEELASGEFVALDTSGLKLKRRRALAYKDRPDLPEPVEVLRTVLASDDVKKVLTSPERLRVWFTLEHRRSSIARYGSASAAFCPPEGHGLSSEG